VDEQCHFPERRKATDHVVTNHKFDTPDEKGPLPEDEEQMTMLFPHNETTSIREWFD
jgi:hypothetical protein